MLPIIGSPFCWDELYCPGLWVSVVRARSQCRGPALAIWFFFVLGSTCCYWLTGRREGKPTRYCCPVAALLNPTESRLYEYSGFGEGVSFMVCDVWVVIYPSARAGFGCVAALVCATR